MLLSAVSSRPRSASSRLWASRLCRVIWRMIRNRVRAMTAADSVAAMTRNRVCSRQSSSAAVVVLDAGLHDQPGAGENEGDGRGPRRIGFRLAHQCRGHVPGAVLHIEPAGNLDLLHLLARRDRDAKKLLDQFVFALRRTDEIDPYRRVRQGCAVLDRLPLEIISMWRVDPEHGVPIRTRRRSPPSTPMVQSWLFPRDSRKLLNAVAVNPAGKARRNPCQQGPVGEKTGVRGARLYGED